MDEKNSDNVAWKFWLMKSIMMCVVAVAGVAAYLYSNDGGMPVSGTTGSIKWTAYRSDTVSDSEESFDSNGSSDMSSDMSVAAHPNDSWTANKGSIHLQIVGPSIPAISGLDVTAIDGDGTLIVTPIYDKSNGGIQTMDISVSEWDIDGGKPEKVTSVKIKRDSGVTEAKKVD